MTVALKCEVYWIEDKETKSGQQENILSDAGINIKLAGGRGSLGKLHHKLMVIDDQLSIFVSFNYTKPVNSSNDENIVIVGDLDESRAELKNKQGQFAISARAEIDRIITTFGE